MVMFMRDAPLTVFSIRRQYGWTMRMMIVMAASWIASTQGFLSSPIFCSFVFRATSWSHASYASCRTMSKLQLQQQLESDTTWSEPFMRSSLPTTPILHHELFHDFIAKRVDWIEIPRALPLDWIQDLARDALQLQYLGWGQSAGVQSHTDGIRSPVHQIWLTAPGMSTVEIDWGMPHRRKAFLHHFVHDLRQCLEQRHGGSGSLPRHWSEVSYLIYPSEGSYYHKHVDTLQQGSDRPYRRAVSWILYLGDPTSMDSDDNHHEQGLHYGTTTTMATWDPLTDGGVLRMYSNSAPPATSDDMEYCDVVPHPGTLVLLDSATVPHEVLLTHRPRACIVGWFNTPI
jgi:hypothetical protein